MGAGVTVRPSRASTAQLLALHASDPAAFPHFLVSGGAGGRFDILFAAPEAARLLPAGAGAARMQEFFAGIERRLDPGATDPAPLPFTHGDFVYFSYELGQLFEPRLALAPPPLPLAFAQYCRAALVHDHQNGHTMACAQDPDLAASLARRAAAMRPQVASRVPVCGITEEDPARYLAGIARIQDYIRAGDVFQVNLSRGYSAELAPGTEAAQVMAALVHANPAPYAALATLGKTAIVSASPERLLEVRGSTIRSFPIAGTAPRQSDGDDEAARLRLRAHPKERAEHVMLVDLERNDIGRVCAPGSVRVPSLMHIESYATVHHLVSTVEGTLRPATPMSAILRSLFPGGTITGCPKVRCMEILAELEAGPRGAYTGSLGYVNACGDMDLNILIRTAVLGGDSLSWRVGGGIVADSDPAAELAETRAKAAGLLRAFQA